ncbi:MAG TPA: hypothetical protein VMB21_10125 [Candidatus Limnocylindria bacterium]|nr:hypothetical protein [Candidatus Limnocylindria bacterium]
MALDLTAAKEGMEVTGEFQSSFFLGDKSGTGSRQSMEATEPVRHSRSGQQRNRQRLNDRVRMGCETRQLKN